MLELTGVEKVTGLQDFAIYFYFMEMQSGVEYLLNTGSAAVTAVLGLSGVLLMQNFETFYCRHTLYMQTTSEHKAFVF